MSIDVYLYSKCFGVRIKKYNFTQISAIMDTNLLYIGNLDQVEMQLRVHFIT